MQYVDFMVDLGIRSFLSFKVCKLSTACLVIMVILTGKIDVNVMQSSESGDRV